MSSTIRFGTCRREAQYAASNCLFNAHYDEYGLQPIVVFDGDGRFVSAIL